MEMQFSMLENEAYNAGYDLWVQDYQMIFRPRRGEEYLPDFFVRREDVGDGMFVTMLSFSFLQFILAQTNLLILQNMQ